MPIPLAQPGRHELSGILRDPPQSGGGRDLRSNHLTSTPPPARLRLPRVGDRLRAPIHASTEGRKKKRGARTRIPQEILSACPDHSAMSEGVLPGWLPGPGGARSSGGPGDTTTLERRTCTAFAALRRCPTDPATGPLEERAPPGLCNQPGKTPSDMAELSGQAEARISHQVA